MTTATPNHKAKQRPKYHVVLFALMNLYKIKIVHLAKESGLSRPFVMRILVDPNHANGEQRAAIAKALTISTRFLDDIITGNISPNTKFKELYILQENEKAEAEQSG